MLVYRWALKGVLIVGLALTQAFAQESSDSVQESAPSPVYADGAELFGITFNDLSKNAFETHLKKMGLEPYPSYRQGVASYSLGKSGILGIKELTVRYNPYQYVEKATLSGVVEDPELRARLGEVLLHKYGQPNVGFVNDGYGRARWELADGTDIELRNTTFDVSVVYIDRRPKRVSASGRIDVEALLKRHN